MVVQASYVTPQKVKGKTQLPQLLETAVMRVSVGFNPSEQVPDSSPTACIASLFCIKTSALLATPAFPREVPVGG